MGRISIASPHSAPSFPQNLRKHLLVFSFLSFSTCCSVAKSCPTLWPPWTVASQASLSPASSEGGPMADNLWGAWRAPPTLEENAEGYYLLRLPYWLTGEARTFSLAPGTLQAVGISDSHRRCRESWGWRVPSGHPLPALGCRAGFLSHCLQQSPQSSNPGCTWASVLLSKRN